MNGNQPGAYDVREAMDAIGAFGEVMAGILAKLHEHGLTRDEAAAIIVAQQQQAAAETLKDVADANAKAQKRGLFG